MDMTPFRWRRRIRVISSSTGSSTLVPGDLRITLPHIERLNVVQPIELLPGQPWDRQLDQRRGRGKRIGGRGELHVVAHFFQLPTVHERAVSDQQDLLGRSEEHTSELQSRVDTVCRLLLEKKKQKEGDVGADRGQLRGETGSTRVGDV